MLTLMQWLWKNCTDTCHLLMIAVLFLPQTAFPWDATGHRLIAAIAYSQLTPQVRQTVDKITAQGDQGYPPLARFLYAATQPDKWRQNDGGESAAWHYLDTPWSVDGTPAIPAAKPNLLSMMQQSENTLTNPQASSTQKARALAYVLHLAGDAHQPLHCINRINAQFPKGDRGGNLFPIQDSRVSNLHAFWDQGAIGLVPPNWRYPLTNKNVLRLSKQLQQRYPLVIFGDKAQDKAVSNWTAQCYAIAKATVYSLAPNTKPSPQYRAQVATVAAEQFTLAGYRLGNLLNSLLANS